MKQNLKMDHNSKSQAEACCQSLLVAPDLLTAHFWVTDCLHNHKNNKYSQINTVNSWNIDILKS